ncbi:MAG: hypothetical protein JSW71_06690 [Gemmatimonadota bacterium]|nr:MAG: hypothetical protein JSW71_06690 [Gemmatimonadota bacterium]
MAKGKLELTRLLAGIRCLRGSFAGEETLKHLFTNEDSTARLEAETWNDLLSYPRAHGSWVHVGLSGRFDGGQQTHSNLAIRN